MNLDNYIGLLIAILSFAGTLIGSYFANRKQAALLAYRMDQIEKRVDELSKKIEKVMTYEK